MLASAACSYADIFKILFSSLYHTGRQPDNLPGMAYKAPITLPVLVR
jgi:hypothetical protein